MPEHRTIMTPAPLGVILASATLTVMAGSVIAPVLNPMREGLGAAPSAVGMIITTHGLFMALFSPLMGSVVDRAGARGVYLFSLVAYGLAGGSGLFINSFGLLLISRAFLGIALAGVFTTINVLILNLFEGDERHRVMGWRGTAQSFGGVVWPFLGGALGTLSWHAPFGVYTVALPLAVVALYRLPAQPRKSAPTIRTGPTVWTVFSTSRVLFVIYGLMFTANVLLYVVVIYLPQLLETFGVTSTFRIGLTLAGMTAAAGITSFNYGFIRGRVSYGGIVLMAVTVQTVAFLSLSMAASHPAALASVALIGVSHGLVMPTVMVWIGDAVPAVYRGRFSSYLGSFGFIGQFLSPILFAPVMILLGLKGVFLTASGLAGAWLAGVTWWKIVKHGNGQIPRGGRP